MSEPHTCEEGGPTRELDRVEIPTSQVVALAREHVVSHASLRLWRQASHLQKHVQHVGKALALLPEVSRSLVERPLRIIMSLCPLPSFCRFVL